MLPSLAYGTKKCSLKYKQYPIAKFVRSLKLIGKKYISIIGYDISEKDRAEKAMESNKKSNGGVFKGFDIDFCFPLIDWKMGRDQCVELSKTVGFCTAKSSCYYCPAMRKNEVLKLKREYPDLFQKAIALEDHSKSTRKSVRGLGRNWSWTEVGQQAEDQGVFEFMDDMMGADMKGCGCTDWNE
jgi:hypothetical protein